jgi:tRNA-Thr(GGU) m(6)t(6)A37 methyltransferase TsaA
MYSFTPIGYIQSSFSGKFGTPRQSGLVPESKATLTLDAPYNDAAAVKGLEEYSHLWILYYFHLTAEEGWNLTVRPPRLGGNERLGVFATRSNFRPNPFGMSVAKIEKIDTSVGVKIFLSNIDIISGTPVLDIKPYLPYSDSQLQAISPFEKPETLIHIIHFSTPVEKYFLEHPSLKPLIVQVLQQDPRPAYQRDTKEKIYHFELEEHRISFQSTEDGVEVTEITKA